MQQAYLPPVCPGLMDNSQTVLIHWQNNNIVTGALARSPLPRDITASCICKYKHIVLQIPGHAILRWKKWYWLFVCAIRRRSRESRRDEGSRGEDGTMCGYIGARLWEMTRPKPKYRGLNEGRPLCAFNFCRQSSITELYAYTTGYQCGKQKAVALIPGDSQKNNVDFVAIHCSLNFQIAVHFLTAVNAQVDVPFQFTIVKTNHSLNNSISYKISLSFAIMIRIFSLDNQHQSPDQHHSTTTTATTARTTILHQKVTAATKQDIQFSIKITDQLSFSKVT